MLWGPGGVGKSTLALKFAAGQAERGDGWLWLVFRLSDSIMEQDCEGLLDAMLGKKSAPCANGNPPISHPSPALSSSSSASGAGRGPPATPQTARLQQLVNPPAGAPPLSRVSHDAAVSHDAGGCGCSRSCRERTLGK